jgi:hypothetical protein
MKRGNDDVLDAALKFVKTHRMTTVIEELRSQKKSIYNADWHEFNEPNGRGLREEHISIIADEIGVEQGDARRSYLHRGGRIRAAKPGRPARIERVPAVEQQRRRSVA